MTPSMININNRFKKKPEITKTLTGDKVLRKKAGSNFHKLNKVAYIYTIPLNQRNPVAVTRTGCFQKYKKREIKYQQNAINKKITKRINT